MTLAASLLALAVLYGVGRRLVRSIEGPGWDRTVEHDPTANTRPLPDEFGRLPEDD